MDTLLWSKLCADPDRYKDGYRDKNNFLECDFNVIPMHEQYGCWFFLHNLSIIYYVLQKPLENWHRRKPCRVYGG